MKQSILLLLAFAITGCVSFTTPILKPQYINTSLEAGAKAAAESSSEDTKAVVVSLKKGDFVTAISEKTGLSKIDSEAALAAVIDTVVEEVSAGNRISLQGFGSFKLTSRAARKGRNPKTGEPIDIKASQSPKFTPSKAFKEICNPGR
uniref:DNA-binding protein HU n=1 Tax=Proboscia inermis TaxID=420281 RepID=A0A7S0CA69_9STRA|mmetsp:Transcript_35936/g.36159  ORF Transcript_35936/g.36159 Transcript_35936/m.36159 type:complete len:148 (+) Transcript_35936:96-539(+)